MTRKLTALLLAMLMLPFSAMDVLADEGDPDLSINEITFSDDSPTGGDTIIITAEVANDGGSSGLVSVTTNVSFYWDGNYIGKDSITVPGSNTADAEIEWKAVGGSHTITAIVDEEEQIRESDEDNNEETQDITVEYPLILFLDDDNSSNNGGTRTETDGYYSAALDNMSSGMGYDIIRVDSGQNAPDYDTLSQYSLIIWACGADYQSGDTDVTFTNEDKTNVANFLEDGGALWAIGHDILYDFDSADGERGEGDFEYDYLGVAYADHDRTTPATLYGVDDDPISDGAEYSADAISTDFGDDINPRDGFEKVFNSGAPDSYNISTIRTEEDFKLVFMAVDFSSITESSDRDELMENIVEYLVEQLENDVAMGRFNTPQDGHTVEPDVTNLINVTVRNRGTEDQSDVEVDLDIRCLNNTYRFTATETISINTGESAFVEFEWDTPDDEDYEYEIKTTATIANDEKEDNNVKQISVNTYVLYDVELSEGHVNPMIAEKDTERNMSVLVTNTGDVSMNSDVTGKVYDGAGGVVYNGGSQNTGDLSPGDSISLDWQWETDEYGTFWFEAELSDEDDEIPENDLVSVLMRSVDIEFSDDMEDGTNGWTNYKSLSNPWHLIDTDEDDDREASSPTHAMWVGDESKGDGEYDNNWDFSLYTAIEHTLGTSPTLAVDIWYHTEFSWDGGNVQISTDGGENWEVITPDGGYPDDAVVGLDNEPGYTGVSGDGESSSWVTANFNLGNYSSEDVRFKFRFGTDASVNTYEGWYIDNFQIKEGITTNYEDDFEDGDDDWGSDVVLSEWNYHNIEDDYGNTYSGDYSWYLGNPNTGAYSASLNDSLETPMIDLGDGSEKYVSAMLWFGIDGPADSAILEINISGEWETVDSFPGDDGDYSEEYDDADDNGWLYVESDVSEYEGDASFRIRFVSDAYTQYDGIYIDDFTLYSLPPIPNDVGTKDLDAPDTAKPGRAVTFSSNIYNFGTEDQDSFDVRGTVTKDDGTEVYNQTQTVNELESKDNVTLDWVWEGGDNGTYTIRVETLLDGDERAGNNPKESDIDVAESGYNIALSVEEQAKDVLSGESVIFNFTAKNTGENSGYYDITVDYSSNPDEWKIISHTSVIYLASGSSYNFTVAVISPTLANTGDEHQFSVTITSRDDSDTEDSQDISVTPFYYDQADGDKVLLIDANFGKNNGYNNYYDIDKIDARMKLALQQYFNNGESRGYDVYTIPYDVETGYGELHPYPTNELMSNYDVVVWVQGDHHQRNLTNWKTCIGDYLDSGGSMWIMGQQFMTALNSTTGSRDEGSFEYDYLKVQYVSDSSGVPNPLLGVDDDEIFSDAEYDMGDRSIIGYDYTDWIRPTDDAVGAFYTGNSNWWHIVDTEQDSNRKAYSPTHSMWIGDESKGNGEYESGWDYSIYTSSEYGLSTGGQLKFQHYYSTESSTYPYDGGNVQITTNDGEDWEVIYPDGGYPGDSVSGLDGESGYYGDSGGWVEASFDLSNFTGEDVRFRFRFGSDSVTDNYEGWYFDNVELTDSVSGTLLSDDFEDGSGNWDDAPQVFNVSLHYQGDYRIIVSPFTFAFVNNSEDREDMVGRALDWLRAAAAADDVGVDSLYIETPTNENSTIAFSSVIKNYGSDPQSYFDVEARVEDADGNEIWSEIKEIINLDSGEEETLDWEWESENPSEVTFIVETLKEDESHRNNLKEEDIEITMICIPEITTFNDHKEGEPGDDVMFDLIVSNRASGNDIFEIEMTGSAVSWGQITNQLELHSNESRDIELALKIDEDTDLGDYDLNIIITASDGTTEELNLLISVTDNPVNYEVEIELDPTSIETIAGRDVEVEITIYNRGDEQDTFDLESRGEEASWINFEENGILIGAGGEDTITATISVPADAEDGNSYVEIWAISRNDQSAEDDKTVKIIVEELTIGATLIRDSSGIMDIEPGTSGDFEFTILSDSNGAQLLTILTEGDAGEWATSTITEINLEAQGEEGDAATFTVTVDVPQGTPEATYRLEVIIMFNDDEVAKSVSNIVAKALFVEEKELELCLTSTNTCFSSSNGMSTFDLTIDMEADAITSEQFDFTIENLGNVDTIIEFEINGPNDMTTNSMLTYTDGEGKTVWMVSIMPENILDLKDGDMEFGTLSILANKPEPGSYTYTLVWMEVTTTGNNDMGQISVNINIEGETTAETANEEEDSLLPGPSFVSVISLLGLIVYRRKK